MNPVAFLAYLFEDFIIQCTGTLIFEVKGNNLFLLVINLIETI